MQDEIEVILTNWAIYCGGDVYSDELHVLKENVIPNLIKAIKDELQNT